MMKIEMSVHILVALAFPAAQASAAVYKCTSANGEIVFSQVRCADNAQKLDIQDNPQRDLNAAQEYLIRRQAQERHERNMVISKKKEILEQTAAGNPQLKNFLDSIKIWEATYELGTHTPRMALSNVISQLAEKKNRIFFMDLEACYKSPREILVKAMDAYIESLSKFMINQAKSGDVVSAIYSEAGDKTMEIFWKSMPEICRGP
jgi:hypothetical protein